MPFNFNYQTTPLLFFLVQGLVFSGLILRKARLYDNKSGRWLALFVTLSCLYVVPWMCGYSGWYGRDGYREFLFFVPFQQLFFLGPALYFYVRSLLNKEFRFSRHQWWHFAPGLLYLSYSLVVFVYDQFLVEEYYFYADGRDKDMASWYQATGFLSMLVYAILSFRYYNSYRKLIFQQLSYADAVAFGWVRKFLIALLAILLLRFVFFLLYPGFGSFGPKWWYYLLFSGLGYYIALVGYSNTMESLVAFRLSGDGAEAELIATTRAATVTAVKEEAHIEEPKLEDLRRQIAEIMEEGQRFRNPKLTLSDLAAELSVTSKQVSRVINLGFQQNFNDFVNGYRVEAVKTAFAAGQHQTHTILGVALEAGFNSKSTFNRVFKKQTGLTPLGYLKKNRLKSVPDRDLTRS